MEISDTQAAATLLGFDISQCSESFWLYDSASMQNFIHDEYTKEIDGESDESVATEDTSSLSDDSFIDDSFIDDNSSIVDGSISDDEFEGDPEEQEEVDDSMVDGVEQLCDREQQRSQSNQADLPNCPFEAYHGDSRYGRKFCNTFHAICYPLLCCFQTATKCPNSAMLTNAHHFSACPVYKVMRQDDTGKLEFFEIIPYAKQYRYRGKDLKDLSRLEYFCCVTVRKPKQEVQLEPGQTQRRQRNNSFKFDGTLKISESHMQILRSKQCTLKFIRNPPGHPGPKPDPDDKAGLKSWKRKADKFAAFYLILLRPEDKLYGKDQTFRYKYDWDAFVEFVEQIQNSDREIDVMRYETMVKIVHGWKTRPRHRIILAMHRQRARTIWTPDEKREARRINGESNASKRKMYNDLDLFHDGIENLVSAMQPLSPAEQKRALSQVRYGDQLLKNLGCFATRPESTAISETATQLDPMPIRSMPCNSELADSIKSAKPKKEQETTSDSNAAMAIPTIGERIAAVQQYIREQNISSDKMAAINAMMGHYIAIANGNAKRHDYHAPRLLITGDCQLVVTLSCCCLSQRSLNFRTITPV